jgi:hypothetical protein
MNKSRRVVLVSAKPIAGRAWKSLVEDECVETSKDQSAAPTGKTLRLTQCNKPPYQPVASAGSLAVIFQPAFVPFFDAVDYLQMWCLFMPVSVACAAEIAAY